MLQFVIILVCSANQPYQMAAALPDKFMIYSAESRDATNTTIIQTLLNTFYLQSVACLHNNDGGGKASQSLSLLNRAIGAYRDVGAKPTNCWQIYYIIFSNQTKQLTPQ